MTILFETKLLWNTVTDIPDVSAPVNLHSYYDSYSNSINLTWESRSPDETGQRIYRNLTPTSVENLGEPYALLGAGITEYEDVSVTEGQVYYYYVSAVSGGNEAISAELRAKTVLVPPFDISGEVEEVEEGDPHWDKVVALLHMDSDQFYDEAGTEWIPESGVEFDALIKSFGSGSAYFPGIGSTTQDAEPRLSKQGPANYLMGSEDFTIEAFIYPKGYPATNNFIVGLYSTTNGQRSWAVVVDATGQFSILLSSDGASLQFQIRGGHCPEDKWTHVAATRQSGTVRIFVDGMLVNSGTFPNHLHPSSTRPTVGARSNGSYGFRGNIDELRITKGLARYTGDFTPPTEPFPNSGPPKPYPTDIGEFFGGGYYIGNVTIAEGSADDGTYAIIMGGPESQATLAWKDPSSATAGTDSTTNGRANTLAMQASDPAIHRAAMHCLNYRGGRHDDWYLGAKDELDLAWRNRAELAVLAMERTYYWSSTQYSADFAWSQTFSSGSQTPGRYKHYSDRVRPFRRIKLPE